MNGRLERSALSGVLVREVVNFSSFWKSTTFSSTVQPTIYLIAFGFGFGSLVTTVDGYDYVQFVATGTVATGVLFASVFPAMFGTFVKFQFQRTYDAILAAPVDTEELVTAEALWIGARAGVYGSVPLLVGMVFGLDPAWGMLTVPFIGFLAGFGWGACGIMIAGIVKSIDGFSYVSAALLTPLFLVAGTFFPLTSLPHWAQVLGNLNPLYHLRPARPRRLVRLAGLGRRRPPRGDHRLRPGHVAPGDRVPAAPADRLVQVNGVELCVETFGAPADPAVLLVMGAAASMDWWEDDFCARLAAGPRFVIRYDHRDTGQSASYPPGAPGTRAMTSSPTPSALLDALGVRRAHVVGQSMGGALAQLIALDHPERVASLTLDRHEPGRPGRARPPADDRRGGVPPSRTLAEPDWSDRAAVIDYLTELSRALAGRSRPFDEQGTRALLRRASWIARPTSSRA